LPVVIVQVAVLLAATVQVAAIVALPVVIVQLVVTVQLVLVLAIAQVVRLVATAAARLRPFSPHPVQVGKLLKAPDIYHEQNKHHH
jgi:hypothetical protein